MEYIKPFWEDVSEEESPVTLYEVNTEHERLVFRSTDTLAGGRTHSTPDPYNGVIKITPTPTVEEFNVHG